MGWDLSHALPVAIALAGAVLGLACWSRPRALLAWALLVSLASFASLAALASDPAAPPVGLPFLALVPIVACLSLLGQPPHEDNRAAWILTLLLLGLGLGVLLSRDGVGTILLALVLSLLGSLIHRYRAMSVSHPWWGLGTCAVGVAALLAGLPASLPASAVAQLAACAILLPLAPLHGGYVAGLAGLPGNLPAFLAFLLPALGFHSLLMVLPDIPEAVAQALVILGPAGTLYGAVKALVQSRVRALLAYANLSFFSILWWYAAATRTLPTPAVIYVGAVGLATGGLLLTWYAIRVRYGDMDLRAIRGLAQPMPRFAVLFTLLALAALGLPPFGVFAGFMGLLLAPSLPLSGALIVIITGWLAASWYFLDLVQRLIFGQHRPDLRYQDLWRSEFAALLGFIVLLLALGLLPPRVLDPRLSAQQARPSMEVVTWNR